MGWLIPWMCGLSAKLEINADCNLDSEIPLYRWLSSAYYITCTVLSAWNSVPNISRALHNERCRKTIRVWHFPDDLVVSWLQQWLQTHVSWNESIAKLKYIRLSQICHIGSTCGWQNYYSFYYRVPFIIPLHMTHLGDSTSLYFVPGR
jgi:hypothetical protein